MYGKCYLALYNSTGGWEASGISVLSQLKNVCFCRWDMTCSRHTFAAATPKEHTPDPWKVAYLRMARHPRISSRACGFRRPISRFFVRSPNEMLFVVARLATSGSSQRTAVPRQRGTSVPAWLHKTRKTLSSQMYLRCYLILVRGKYRKTIHWGSQRTPCPIFANLARESFGGDADDALVACKLARPTKSTDNLCT